MQDASIRAEKLAGKALGAFRTAHDQLAKSNELHAQAHAELTEAAARHEQMASEQRAAAAATEQAIAENARVQSKLAEFLS